MAGLISALASKLLHYNTQQSRDKDAVLPLMISLPTQPQAPCLPQKAGSLRKQTLRCSFASPKMQLQKLIGRDSVVLWQFTCSKRVPDTVDSSWGHSIPHRVYLSLNTAGISLHQKQKTVRTASSRYISCKAVCVKRPSRYVSCKAVCVKRPWPRESIGQTPMQPG